MKGLAFLGVCLLALCSACAGSKRSKTPAYGDDARASYEQALLAFRRDDCITAAPMFKRVRQEFPYSRFSALAELRIADCKYKDNDFSEAISAYRQFLRGHPSHKQVPYARFRVAESYFKQIPSGWFMTPPSFERDQSATRDALIQLRRFVVDFPKDDRVPEAQRMIDKCLRVLGDHEMYVARFYLRRDAYQGVISRLKGLLASYSGSGLEPEALLLLGQVYLKAKDPIGAKEALSELVERFPDSKQAKEARPMLRKLTSG